MTLVLDTLEVVMELTEALKQAAKIVEEADLPADLRTAAFEKAVDSLMGSPVGAAPAQARTLTGPTLGGTASQGGLHAIALRLGLSKDVIDEVFEVKDNTLDVILGYSRIASGTAAGARQLAVLVVAGRQAAGIDADGWTSAGEIRAICKEFNKFDQANFASTIAGMHQWFSVSGTGQSRKVKMTRAGWEHAAQLVTELTS